LGWRRGSRQFPKKGKLGREFFYCVVHIIVIHLFLKKWIIAYEFEKWSETISKFHDHVPKVTDYFLKLQCLTHTFSTSINTKHARAKEKSPWHSQCLGQSCAKPWKWGVKENVKTKKKKKLSEEKNPHSYIWQTLDCIPHWSAGFIPGKEIHTGHCHQLLARVNPDLDWFLYYPTENKVYSKLIALFELS